MIPLHGVENGRCMCRKPSCASPGKHPIGSLVPHGLLDATLSAEQVGRWLTLAPKANFAVPTGEATFDAIDIDARHGGWASLAQLVAHNGAMPAGPVSATGGGGAHYLFAPTGLRNTVGGRRTLPAGIDFRGQGGFVVIPPSTHVSGNAYEWAITPAEVPLPTMPAWLITLINPPRAPRPMAQPVQRAGGRGYGEAALAGEVEAVRSAAEGTRNVTLYEAALKIGSLVGAGLLDAHRAVGTIVDAGLAAGLGEAEVVATVRSGFAVGLANPRQVAS